MVLQSITVRLPDLLYRRVEHRAQRMRRSIEEELVDVVSAALPTADDLSPDIAGDLAQMVFMTDAELWQAAQTELPLQDSAKMQALMFKRQREGLTTAEEREAKRLAHRADRTMLVRSRAAALLQDRGHDISSLRPAKATA
jgi:plasmid stability protein